MCGLIGVLLDGSTGIRLERPLLERMRDAAPERGPDAVGLWLDEAVGLGHRRLAIRGLGPAGAQPVLGERYVVAYNGELYDTGELERELAACGVTPAKAGGDTALLIAALETFGLDVLSKLRGMFALAVWDRRDKRLTLARDGLGVKPLYWWRDARELVFASDVRSILVHPRVPVRPDFVGISEYLTNLRVASDERSLFDGVRMLGPGATLTARIVDGGLELESGRFVDDTPVDPGWTLAEAEASLREALDDSVRSQLVADVPVCALLSGGLDSSAIVALAKPSKHDLRTYSAGSREADEDLRFAQVAARELGTDHSEVVVEEQQFLDRWRHIVDTGGWPLSTPNEVAILEVSRRLREDGCLVTLSGEAADELLGGYDAVLEACRPFDAVQPSSGSGGRFHLGLVSWLPTSLKPILMNSEIWNPLEDDAALVDSYETAFERARLSAGDEAESLDVHLRFLAEQNLAKLLDRLDRSTMLASVEGRVPFADQRVARVANSLPARLKLPDADEARGLGLSTDELRSKLVLRRGMKECVPGSILARPKASFPLPFDRWLDAFSSTLQESNFARQLFAPDALEIVGRKPSECPAWMWPMVNIAMWGDRWFSED